MQWRFGVCPTGLRGLLLAGLAVGHACAATNELARVLDGAGGAATSAFFQTRLAAAQPHPVGYTRSAAYENHSGFFRTFVVHPALDADADGKPDEFDGDDDNDGLTDVAELTGVAFSPTTLTAMFNADSDDDGATDGAEATAGSNPLDAQSLLAITDVLRTNNGVVVQWQGRDARTYALLAGSNMHALVESPAVVTQRVGQGGVPPWFETLESVTNAISDGTQFYRVRVL